MNPLHSTTSAAAGFVVATLLIIGTPIFGIVLCSKALRRPASNRRCTLAMLLILVAWVSIFSIGMGTQVFGRIDRLITFTATGIAVLSAIPSVVLAIIGLVQCARHRDRCDRGVKRAIFALLIGGVILSVFAHGIYTGAQKRKALFAPLPPPAQHPSTVNIGGLSLKLPAAPEAAANAISNEACNFRLEPPLPWNAISPNAFGPNARAALARQSPEMFSMVMTENFPATSPLTPQAATDLIKHNLQGRGSLDVFAEHEFNVHGMQGWWMEAQSRTAAGAFYYVRWVTLNNGTMYQIVTWGNTSQVAQLRAESQKLVAGFHFIDPNRNSLSPAELAPATFASERFGYSIDLHGTGWTRRFSNLATAVPAAEFGVDNAAGTACFVVIPVWVGDDAADLHSLTHALASQLGVPYPDDAVYGEKDWTQGQLHGLAFAYEAQREGVDFVYRLRLLRGHGFAYLLGSWMTRKSATQTDHLDEAMDRVKFLDQAPPQPELGSSRERETHALIYNQLGLDFDRTGQSEQARPWFKRAYEITRHNPTLLINYARVCLKTSQPAEALAALDEGLPNFPSNQKVAACRAEAQAQSGDIDGALKTYGELFDAGWKSDPDFTGYVRELCARKRMDDALAALDHYTAGHESTAMRRLRAEVFLAQGNPDQAIETLTALQEKFPDDQATALGLIDAYVVAHRLSDALAECDRLIATQHDSVEVLRRKGMAEFSLKHYREAKTTLERALAKAPTNLEIQRLLEGLSGLLGEGHNTPIKNPIEPVAIPAALLQPEDADPKDEYLRGYSAWYRCAVKAIAYRKGKEFKTTEHEVIQIRDQQGVEKFSTLQFSYDPLGEEIFVNDLVVKDATGQVVSREKVDDYYVVDDGADKTASQAKILNVPVPGLQPGSTLEYTITRRETGLIKAFTFQTCLLLKGLPVLRNTLLVQAAREDIRWTAAPAMPAPQKDDASITWSVRRPAVYRWEPLQAPLYTFAPMVWVGDASATWAGESRDYLAQIKDRLPIDASVHTAAEEATKGLTTPSDKIAALARFVQRGLTYKAIEFGRRARIPNSSAQTLRNKYGDCKDHALLLTQLLESAGIPARMALVHHGGDVQTALPSLDQFDHAITYVPGEKGGTFIDTTNKSADFRDAPPLTLAGQQALILDPKGAHLQAIPAMPGNNSIVTAHRKVSFSNESDLSIEEDVTFTGGPAEGLRILLLALEPPQRIAYLQRMISGQAPSVNLRDATFEELDDPHAPLRLQLHYALAGDFHPAGDQLAGQLPAIWERLYVSGDAMENRFSPFKLWDTTQINSTVELAPPPGWHPTLAKGAPVKNPYTEASLKASTEHDLLRLESQLTQQAGQFPADQYSTYVDDVRQIRALTEQNIVLMRKK